MAAAVRSLICLAIVVAAEAVAQTEPVFDVGVERLPARFQGNSVEWVLHFGTLQRKTLIETDADYAARRAAFRSKVFAFVPEQYEIQYSSTSETIHATLDPAATRVDSLPSHFFTAFDIRRVKLPPSSRAGRSKLTRSDRPYAAERGVVLSTMRAVKKLQIITEERTLGTSAPSISVLLKMAPGRAKAAKSGMRIALVCMPRLEQYAPTSGAAVSEATGVEVKHERVAQATDDTITYFVALRCNLLQVWLFDFATGEVYGRYTPQGVLVPRG